jgi:hypothetical protein
MLLPSILFGSVFYDVNRGPAAPATRVPVIRAVPRPHAAGLPGVNRPIGTRRDRELAISAAPQCESQYKQTRRPRIRDPRRTAVWIADASNDVTAYWRFAPRAAGQIADAA